MVVADGLRRVVATNAGPMTYHGTNTYLVDGDEGITVVDPGPAEHAHVEAVLAATNGRVSHILLTHAHGDHLGATSALRQATGAPVCAYHTSPDPIFTPDVLLHDGDVVAGMLAIHTPGHAPDHLCFAREDGILFSGDHVMGWSSTVVSPPTGDMASYFGSLRRLMERDEAIYLPGHGPALHDPRSHIQGLLKHRLVRELAIENALREGPRNPQAIAAALYAKEDPTRQNAAERNVLAHLLKLEHEGRAVKNGELWTRPDAG